ncbi:uncharacterized protein LOC124404715 [Diprion similis]|uniref:uncharacterized protein LOC124404715 n=1 Tax=Diprion similis TaxID=362088 RepID=UPI001EF859F0|nr:uncharacterized protein LOC124404715 [Diprion similis]
MCDTGFVKATASNLPTIDIFMVTEFLKADDRFNAAEVRGAKASMACRESYGDKAIGYVQLKREGNICTVKRRVCPEHKVRSKAYVATITINEKDNEIQNVQCHDCAAATGGCKHALAFLMWLHRRSEDPAPTEVECYWKKSRLSGVGSAIKYIESKDLGNQDSRSVLSHPPNNETFLQKVLDIAQAQQIDGQISRISFQLIGERTSNLSMHRLALQFYLHESPQCKSVGDFLTLCTNEMTKDLCDEAQVITKEQSNCPLWYDLRYGRITASKLHESAHCKTDNGSLVNQIIGVSKIHETNAMLRGKKLEKDVLEQIQSLLQTNIQNAGLFLLPEFPILGASPDGLTKQYIVEIKCPMNEKSFNRFLSNGVINPRCIAQMQLQMLLTDKKKDYFVLLIHPSKLPNKFICSGLNSRQQQHKI